MKLRIFLNLMILAGSILASPSYGSGPDQNPSDQPPPLKTFINVEENFEQYKETPDDNQRDELINDLYSLVNSARLTLDERDQAAEMAERLGAQNLVKTLDVYDPINFGKYWFSIIDGDVKNHIFSFIFNTQETMSDAKEVFDFSLVNNHFRESLKKLPIRLSFMRMAWKRHNITNKTLEAFIDLCPNMTSLSLVSCSNITDEGLQNLAKLTTLTALLLNSCYEITDGGLQSLTQLTNLTFLNIYGCEAITDPGIEILREKLTNLKKLVF